MNRQMKKETISIQENKFSLVEQIAIYVARNYTRNINISEVGEKVGLHPDYANSVFKKVFGCSIYEYIIKERISHAQRKLVLSDISITEIAFDCGFNSINRFNAAFMKINKCTPREYRKKILCKINTNSIL